VKSTVVSNGYINEEPLKELCDYMDAMKVDLKAYTNKFYKEVCDGTLEPVLKTLKILVERKIWTEIVYLVIPTLNDNPAEIKNMCKWIVDNLGPDVPVHFSRFYPMYQLKNIPPTTVDGLEKIWEIAKNAGVHYVYIGNVPGHKTENTYCPSCNKIVVHRRGYMVEKVNIEKNTCVFCKAPIAGVWE
jgi:pyruvate formate lyase activating enzyme